MILEVFMINPVTVILIPQIRPIQKQGYLLCLFYRLKEIMTTRGKIILCNATKLMLMVAK